MAIAAKASRPVVLADTQDNPGCGGTCDTTGLLEALVRHDAQGTAMCVLTDPAAAAAAHTAGQGAEHTHGLGGRSGPAAVLPLLGYFPAPRLSAGRIRRTGPPTGGGAVELARSNDVGG